MPSKADEMLNEIEGESKNIVVSELIVQHRAAIDELKALVAPVNPGAGDGVYCLYDDLFFLRYILSFNTAAKAQIAVEATIRHRALPASQAMIRSVKTGEFIRSPVFAKWAKYQVAGPLPDEAQISGGPCILIRASMGDPDGLFENVTLAEQLEVNYIFREQSFQQADTVTRRTGRLAKQTLLFDMTGLAMTQMMDNRMTKLHSEVSANSALWYPQLLDKMCMCNAPTWMSYVLGFFRKVLPKRNMDKLELFASMDELWASEWAQRSLNRAFLPAFMGITFCWS